MSRILSTVAALTIGLLVVTGLNPLSSAETAPSATGLAPSVVTRKYQTSISLTSASEFTVQTGRVPAGTYLLSYNAMLYGQPSTSGWCFAKTVTPSKFAAASSTTSNSGGLYGISGTALVALKGAQRISVRCGFEVAADLDSNLKSPFQITLTRVDSATTSPAQLIKVVG